MLNPAIAAFMGAANKRLFYCYHAPERASSRRVGFVLCPPAGREYVFLHRSFRQLANRLTRAGFPVLRFDYFASGDSAGDDDAGSIEQWLDDIATAVDTFRQHAAGARVCLAGFRIGASLAALHAARHRDIDGLILWDPVVDGDRYVDTLLDEHQRWLAVQIFRNKLAETADGSREVVGFVLSPSLENGLRNIRLSALSYAPAPRVLLLTTSPQADPDHLGEHLASMSVAVNRQHVAWPEFWSEGETLDEILMPSAGALQAMLGWAGGLPL
jgi:alpha/beta superfamily hydrolase